MKKIACAVVIVGALSGCAALDSALSVGDEAPATELNSDVKTVIENAEDVGNGVMPGLGWVLGGLLTISAIGYRIVRKNKEEADG